MVRGVNTCDWILWGKTEKCGRSCMGTYCGIHNAKIAKGSVSLPCQVCGKGVRQGRDLCLDCGGKKLYNKTYMAQMRALKRSKATDTGKILT